MHELAIASAIAEKVLARAAGRPGSRVLEVRLALGEWSCVQDEQLAFCYRVITEHTPIAESTLAIERVPAEVQCPHCDYRGRPQQWAEARWAAPLATLACPRCARAATILHGDECAICALKYAA